METPPPAIAEMEVRCAVPGTDAVVVRRDLELPGADGAPLRFDLFLPPDPRSGGAPPVVLIVGGYPDAGFERIFGRPFRRMGPVASWARLLAASGLAAIAAANRDPAADARALLAWTIGHGAEIGVDPRRVGLFASSGNAPAALALLFGDAGRAVRATALLYPFLMDLDGDDAVARAAATFRFADPCAGRSLDDLPAEAGLLLVRAGRDETPGLNASLDRFVARALARDLPLTLVNHPAGAHAFELSEAGDATRLAVGAVLDFLRGRLGVADGA
jgi:acetyl esterase/lipase